MKKLPIKFVSIQIFALLVSCSSDSGTDTNKKTPPQESISTLSSENIERPLTIKNIQFDLKKEQDIEQLIELMKDEVIDLKQILNLKPDEKELVIDILFKRVLSISLNEFKALTSDEKKLILKDLIKNANKFHSDKDLLGLTILLVLDSLEKAWDQFYELKKNHPEL